MLCLRHYCYRLFCVAFPAKKVSIRSGTSNHDLIDITAIELNEPVRSAALPQLMIPCISLVILPSITSTAAVFILTSE